MLLKEPHKTLCLKSGINSYNCRTARNERSRRTREIQVMSGKHFWAFRRRTAVVAVDAMNRRGAEAARPSATMSSRQVIDMKQARCVHDRRLMACLGLYHHVELVLYDVVHRVPRTQTVTHTQ